MNCLQLSVCKIIGTKIFFFSECFCVEYYVYIRIVIIIVVDLERLQTIYYTGYCQRSLVKNILERIIYFTSIMKFH